MIGDDQHLFGHKALAGVGEAHIGIVAMGEQVFVAGEQLQTVGQPMTGIRPDVNQGWKRCEIVGVGAQVESRFIHPFQGWSRNHVIGRDESLNLSVRQRFGQDPPAIRKLMLQRGRVFRGELHITV